MAGLQKRGDSWRVIFRYEGKQHSYLIGEVGDGEARAVSSRVDLLLMRIKQNLLRLPPGCDIVTFMEHDGNPPQQVAVDANAKLTLAGLREAYFASQEGKLEETTLNGIRLHFNHLERILGATVLISPMQVTDLQKYVDKRAAEWIDPNRYRKARREKEATRKKRQFKTPRPPKDFGKDKRKRHPSSATIKKEIISFRTAWNWARQFQGLTPEFPGTKLDYKKITQKMPYMTWDQAEQRIADGDDPDDVWHSVYLRAGEITELLAWVKQRPVSPWVYPMFCLAAYTGARRSEIVRALVSDVDLKGKGVLTIREKKRDKGKITFRRVPLTPVLKEILSEWTGIRGKGKTLFCKANGKEITSREASNYFTRVLRVGKWSVLRGLHVFRHSFISAMASKGIDQRIIDSFVGHCTEEQRRRYAHLYPDVQDQAMQHVFGSA